MIYWQTNLIEISKASLFSNFRHFSVGTRNISTKGLLLFIQNAQKEPRHQNLIPTVTSMSPMWQGPCLQASAFADTYIFFKTTPQQLWNQNSTAPLTFCWHPHILHMLAAICWQLTLMSSWNRILIWSGVAAGTVVLPVVKCLGSFTKLLTSLKCSKV